MVTFESPCINRVFKLWRMRWAVRVVCMGARRDAHRVLVVKLAENNCL